MGGFCDGQQGLAQGGRGCQVESWERRPWCNPLGAEDESDARGKGIVSSEWQAMSLLGVTLTWYITAQCVPRPGYP